MRKEKREPNHHLGLRAKEWVEIRSAAEILSTLDEQGRLDGLPFMPEMLQYCGQRVRVYKVAHKTCDTIKTYKNHGMPNAVHLEGLRCDGGAHGLCQARCLIYWKEAWLKRVPRGSLPVVSQPAGSLTHNKGALPASVDTLFCHTRHKDPVSNAATDLYSCQATTLREATTPLNWYDPRHYVADLRSRNVSIRVFFKFMAYAGLRAIMRRLRHDPAARPGLARGKIPISPVLDLQPGEMVRVRSRKEIYQTIDANRKNRGLWYDIEMEPFSGKVFPVLARVERLIDEKSGKMIEGAVCSGCLSTNRLFCPRSIYPYWREAWLERLT
jgi:hypothetical protein